MVRGSSIEHLGVIGARMCKARAARPDKGRKSVPQVKCCPFLCPVAFTDLVSFQQLLSSGDSKAFFELSSANARIVDYLLHAASEDRSNEV
jgi:hypothetical protein